MDNSWTDKLKEKMAGYTETPSDDVWRKVSGRAGITPDERSLGRVPAWFLPAVGMAAAAAGILLMLRHDPEMAEMNPPAGMTAEAVIEEVPELTEKEYYVRGCTALLDAVGGAIHHIGNVHKYARSEDVPDRTLFVITTDGMENSSCRYSYDKVRRMIERQKERYGWEFIFLGANIDAAAEAGRFGIDSSMAADYHCDETGTAVNFKAIGEAITCVRECSAPLNSEWKKEIDEDFRRRGGSCRR